MARRDTATPDPLRIHRVIARLNVGGPAIHVIELTAGIERFGVRTELLVGSLGPGEADMSYRADARGVSVVRVPGLSPRLNPLQDLRALLSMVRRFREDRPEIVHTHTAKAGALGRLAAVIARVPLRVHTYHGHVLGGSYFSPPVTRFYRFLERALGRLTARILVLSESQRIELVEHLGIDAERVRVVPLGFDLARFQGVSLDSNADARSALGIGEDVAVIGVVGRLVPVKNHPLLLRAVALLRQTLQRPVKLLVVGGGESGYEQSLRDLAQSLELDEVVIWAGWSKELERVYPALDVLALSSHDEGTPVALIEGLATGCPFVARAVGGVPDLLAPGAMARLVETADPTEFARALEQSLNEPPTRAEREDARSRMNERFGIERLLRDIVAVYKDLGVEIGG